MADEQLHNTVLPLLSLLQSLDGICGCDIADTPDHTDENPREGSACVNPGPLGPDREPQEVEAPVSSINAKEQRQRVLDSLCALIPSCASAMAMEILDGGREQPMLMTQKRS